MRARRTGASCPSAPCTARCAPRNPASVRMPSPQPRNQPVAEIQFRIPGPRPIINQLHERPRAPHRTVHIGFAQLATPKGKGSERYVLGPAELSARQTTALKPGNDRAPLFKRTANYQSFYLVHRAGFLRQGTTKDTGNSGRKQLRRCLTAYLAKEGRTIHDRLRHYADGLSEPASVGGG